MTKVYELVDDGDDYDSIGFYSTKENAEIAQKIFDGVIFERELDTGLDKVGLQMFHFEMLEDGKLYRSERDIIYNKNKEPSFIIAEKEHFTFVDITKDGFSESKKGMRPKRLLVSVWANNKGHAIKIAKEKLAELIAEGKW